MSGMKPAHRLERTPRAARLACMLSAALLFLAATSATAPVDSISVQVLVAGKADGFAINADATGATFDEADGVRSNVVTFTTEPALYGDARKQFAAYRGLAKPGAPCEPAAGDPMAVRIGWVEQGTLVSVTFADGCTAMPDDLRDVVRPIGKRLDRFIPLIVPVPAPPRP